MSSLNTSKKHPLQRGFIALLLLVIFFALAVILPRVLVTNLNRSLTISFGFIDVKYWWISNNTLNLVIRNNYSRVIELEKLKCGIDEYSLNNTIVKPGEVVEIKLNISINKTCLATIVYRIDGFKYSKLLVLEPPKLEESGNSNLNSSSVEK